MINPTTIKERPDDVYLTDEEKEFDKLTFQRTYTGESLTPRLEVFQEYARNTNEYNNKKKALSVEFSFRDRELFKIRAESEGLKFQTKLKQVVHLINQGYTLVKG